MKNKTTGILGPSATVVNRMKVLSLAVAIAGLLTCGLRSSLAADTNAAAGGMDTSSAPLRVGIAPDLFVNDTFALAPMFANNEADLAYLPNALSEDNLPWAVDPGTRRFFSQANGVLSKWKNDGTLERMLNKWLPYLENLQSKCPNRLRMRRSGSL